MDNVTPSRVMYDDLKTFGHISRKDVAQILLSDRVVAGGRSLRTRALEDPTYVTRYICDATPGALSERDFVSFSEGARTITHRMIDRMGGEDARKVISDHYCKDAVKPLCAALEAVGRNGTLYANAVEHVASMTLANEKNRALVFVMLFVVTGCLGDPSRAIEIVEDFARTQLSGYFHTQMDVEDDAGEPPAPAEKVFMLVRERDGASIAGENYVIDPSGTEIGRFAGGPSDISKVEQDVSRHHLRIWRENGHWFCEGLDSTAGTTIVSTEKRVTVVEPPERDRPSDWRSEPHEIIPSDLICLGAHTCFRFWELPAPTD